MELWDVLNEKGERTGRTAIHGQGLHPGDYHLVVHIWIRNENGEYLIQKRAEHLEWKPGIWATTGGSVIAGEDSLAGAIRETAEELGLQLEPVEMTCIARITKTDSIVDIWLVQAEAACFGRLQLNDEVSEARWRTKSEIMEMISRAEFFGYDYLHLLPD